MNRDNLVFGDRAFDSEGDFREIAPIADVPVLPETLSDGSEALRYGDVEGYRKDWHPAGENVYGYRNTGSLTLCEQLLRRSGVEISEETLLDHAAQRGRIYVSDQPAASGAMTMQGLAETMGDHHVPVRLEHGQSIEDAALPFEHGCGVMMELSDWELADASNADAGAHRLALVTGLLRDAHDGNLLGFYLNSASGFNDAAQTEAGVFVDADRMERAWFEAGAVSLVTEIPLR